MFSKTQYKKFILCTSTIMLLWKFNQAQTFSNTTADAYNTWNGPLTKTISVTGLPNPLASPSNVLRQINLDLGDGTNTGNVSTFTITLTSPSSTTITISSGLGPNCLIKRLNVKLRDHSSLQFISSYGCGKEPFEIGYYRINTANDFSTFNGENPNGTWTVTITEGTSSEIAYNRVDLIFGTEFTYNDISASTTNDDCTAPACLETGTILIGTNNGYADPGPATDPPLTLGSCSWNGAKNNSAWFVFKASATTTQFTISGVTNSLQILAYSMSGTCAAPTYALVTNGCPDDPVNDTYTSPQYANGCTCNMQLNLSSLTIGSIYYVLVDGNGGAISDFYIEFTGGGVCTWLPVELLYFNAFPVENKIVKTEWATATEINNDYFAIERSKNGTLFEQVGTVQGANNSSIILYYVFYDEHPYSGLSYYRLRQVDYDGQFSYSQIRAVYIGAIEIISIYPNPASEFIQYLVASEDGGIVTVKLFDVLGREAMHKKETIEKGIAERKLKTASLSSGSYLLQISTEKQEKTQKQFIIK